MTKKSGKNNPEPNRTQVLHAVKAWPSVHGILFVPKTEEEYVRAVGVLNILLDEGGADETHALAPLVDVLGTLIEDYENQHVAMPEGTVLDCLRSLMEDHQLSQTDLPEIGSQGVVSEILSGKRKLNIRQIKALSRRFNVSPTIFID